MKKIILILSIGLFTSCTDEQGARNALLDAGYHPIEIGDYGYFDCSEDDHYATRFKAYSPDSSRIVEGCVCGGGLLGKGKTIRLD
jgi:hypothetical protein